MKKFNKFFCFDEESGRVVLTPPNMGSDSWSLRDRETYLLEFGIFDFQEYEGVILEDGNHILQLLDLSENCVFWIDFSVKGKQVVVESVVCNDCYKRHYYSVMPDIGIYNL